MSLALGQNEGYINHIESKSSFPSMQCFFYVCDHLGIIPSEFFDDGKSNPAKLRDVYENLTHLDAAQLDIVNSVINGLLGKKNNADSE